MPAPDAYNTLRDELNRTGVISPEFKSLILSYASAIDREGFAAGKEEGKRTAGTRDRRLTPSEERYLTEAGRLSDIGLDNQIDELSHVFANMLSGERVPSFAREAQQLAAALLLRTRRGGLYLKNEVRER